MSFTVSRAALVGLGLSLLAAPVIAAGIYPGHPDTSPEITAADLAARDKALADDAFEGRGPGTKNGEAAAQWIADEMKRIGLKPGNHGSYFQMVPTVNITLDAANSSLVFDTKEGQINPKFPDEDVYWTPRFKGTKVSVKDSPLVFVGYGVVAPEYNWNDYAGVDVKGKTVIILVNDPGNEDASPDPKFFKGKAMTYYGRWTYKYEEAARQGAAAAIIVHEDAPAAYGWQVVRNSNSGTKSWLDAKNKQMDRVPVQGWISLDTAKDLFKRAGLDYLAQKAAANQRGFKAVAMEGETLSATLNSKIDTLKTRNVVGVLPGSKRPNEYVLYTAHWDHLGIKPDVAGDDKIYNGAVDNGMGSSAILEIAEAFAKDKRRPERSIAFINWTLEEQGLLGSEYFATNPVWPLNHIVGGINLDANLPKGRAHDLVLVGNGASELEDLLTKVLKTQNRVITPDPHPEFGGFYRSDHISLSKVGVPMLDPAGGFDLIEGGTAAGQAAGEDYRAHRYHQPSDEFDPNWDLSGPIQDLDAYYTVGDELANSENWPNWYDGNEFRAIRDKSMAGRK
ncbi:MAG: M28 family peptidase [Alphaproteobacteria bacterium]|nr:M28 family peptidase [Alphaproteobacteria bacterium]